MTDTRIILAGQSNALGYLNTGPAPYAPTARVQIWADTDGDGIGDDWNYMRPGVNTGTPTNPTVWGPEVGFANAWLAAHPDGNLWIVKIAKGSTGLEADPGQVDWAPSSAGEMYAKATAAIAAARANLAATPYAFESFDGALWMQGETDATDPTKAADYDANLAAFLSDARHDWGVSRFVVGRIGDGASMPWSLQVRQGEWADDQADPAMVSFKTIGFELQPDGLHYDAAGQLMLGGSFYSAWVA